MLQLCRIIIIIIIIIINFNLPPANITCVISLPRRLVLPWFVCWSSKKFMDEFLFWEEYTSEQETVD